jgi:hypothetical protein
MLPDAKPAREFAPTTVITFKTYLHVDNLCPSQSDRFRLSELHSTRSIFMNR